MNPNLFEKNVPFSKLTTFRTGGPAALLFRPKTAAALAEALSWAKGQGAAVFMLGNGSNLVVSDKGLPGLTVTLKPHMNRLRIDGREVELEAGVLWPKAAMKTARAGLSGLHGGVGIPGTIGGAVFMNAGIPENRISDYLAKVTVMRTSDQKIFTIPKTEAGFDERYSRFQEETDLVILAATFRLPPEKPEILRRKMRGLMEKRRARQPLSKPSAGCIFRRDGEHLPGRIIDQAGLKGLSSGGAMVSPVHANFIVNAGGASSADIYRLMREVRERIQTSQGITLCPEVQFVGRFTE
jgi:UDP-N-acetylmuramate dehydrogenase